MPDVGCWVSGGGCRLWHCSDTALALFLAPLLYNSWPAPALAWPVRHPVYALVDTGQVRAPRTDPGTLAPWVHHPAPPRRRAAPHGHSTARGQSREAVGLTPGCTRGQTGPSYSLARYLARILPADRYP